MKLNPYLAFNGQCREAFEFYEKALGGKITFIQTIGESPMASGMPAESHGRVMTGHLFFGKRGCAAPITRELRRDIHPINNRDCRPAPSAAASAAERI